MRFSSLKRLSIEWLANKVLWIEKVGDENRIIRFTGHAL
ncbi:hypothetical protein KP78_02520 [Jeotgalibacillus soli]|uniref:Uncharacterized protein n=1 Tax=Jeotgalibacillus soli TaxID=889306 RepID=A0A0C2VSI0_9BACL|nr:hypothetical protein KP78_02520 [Jeotgalibacillus soli]